MLAIRTASRALKHHPAAAASRPLAALAQTLAAPTGTPARQQQVRSASYGSGGSASMFSGGSGGPPNTYFRRERLPANTIIRFLYPICLFTPSADSRVASFRSSRRGLLSAWESSIAF